VKSVFEQALLRFPKEKCKELEMKYVAFQKQRGDRETLETVVIQKRRIYYEEVNFFFFTKSYNNYICFPH
jgi:hypothetical protein